MSMPWPWRSGAWRKCLLIAGRTCDEFGGGLRVRFQVTIFALIRSRSSRKCDSTECRGQFNAFGQSRTTLANFSASAEWDSRGLHAPSCDPAVCAIGRVCSGPGTKRGSKTQFGRCLELAHVPLVEVTVGHEYGKPSASMLRKGTSAMTRTQHVAQERPKLQGADCHRSRSFVRMRFVFPSVLLYPL